MCAYVGNDPINSVDPTGSVAEIVVIGSKVGIPVVAKIGGVIFGAIGGLLGLGGSSAAAKLAAARSAVREEQLNRA